jgi:hypothetical protein
MQTKPDRSVSFILALVQELMQLPTTELMAHLTHRLRTHYEAPYACVHLVDEELQYAFEGSLHYCPPAHVPSEHAPALVQSEAAWLQAATAKGRPVALAEAVMEHPETTHLCRSCSLTDGLSLPLVYEGETLGLLNLYLQEGSLTESDIHALSSLGGVIYGLVKRNQMLRLTKERDEIIMSLARAVEAKDPYTGEHLERVRRHAVSLATALGLPQDEIRAVERAALLHDIGKIGVPDAILTKPGALDDAEWTAMKNHPRIGEAIFTGSRDPELQRCLPGILWHHERPDGRGYPDGLQGDEIPLIARIIAVADAFDALTSDRPYRKGLSYLQAISILRAEAGRQFDSDIVDLFITIREGNLAGAV